MKDQTAVVGIGATPYYKRGGSLPQTELEMACKSILAALDDAGLTVKDLDGFTIYSSSIDPAQVASVLGVPEVRFAASLTSGGGGSAGSLGLAAAAIVSGQAEVCVTVMTLQQAARRLGGTAVSGGAGGGGGGSPYGAGGIPPSYAFAVGSGLISPGHSFAILTRRHMELYGTKREHFAEVAISERANAITRPTSIQREPLTLDEYFNSRMIADPLCLFDYTM
ncbi:MAG: putative nonspecific lipid-transfer protein, partial [Acidimicrobiales bacterium]|nr:putative nonspecific lipid-transfer protein [Acidimicrobiales bacterium]